MRSRSLRGCLLKLILLVPLTLDNMVPTSARLDFRATTTESRNFTCKKPQLRSYNLKDLLQSMHKDIGVVFVLPIYIVVKRCDGHSGCCPSSDRICTPEPSSIYYEEFQIEIRTVKEKDPTMRWITVEQHGNCICKFTSVDERKQMEYLQPKVTFA
ncbi:uncharacterized protein LOC144470875 [Augochlora pura]